MAVSEQIKDELRELSIEIGRDPENTEALMGRGKLYYRAGMFGPAANDFKQALETVPDNIEAREFLTLIDEILNYRNTDLLNP